MIRADADGVLELTDMQRGLPFLFPVSEVVSKVANDGPN